MRKSACYQLFAFLLLTLVLIDRVRGTVDWQTGPVLVIAAIVFCTGVILKEMGR